MLSSDTIQVNQPHTHSISEMSILKITALTLLIFVHSDLVNAYPKIMYPLQWFLLSVFFFIAGYLACASFQRRGKSLRHFFKSKAKSLYIPFVISALFYLVLSIAMGANIKPIEVISQISMLNIFDCFNAVCNWGSLWFIPFLLLFMTITCVLEKYLKSTKLQLLIISTILGISTILWAYDTPLKIDGLFSQYLLVFVFGFYVSKFNFYEKLTNCKMAFVSLPLIFLFTIDLSSLFNYNTVLNAIIAQLYFNTRSIVLTLSLVIIALMILRKIKIPVNSFMNQIASHSAFIYLSEPFISFVILTYIFGEGEIILASGIIFYLYQALRIIVLLGVIPLIFIIWGYRHRIPFQTLLAKRKFRNFIWDR